MAIRRTFPAIGCELLFASLAVAYLGCVMAGAWSGQGSVDKPMRLAAAPGVVRLGSEGAHVTLRWTTMDSATGAQARAFAGSDVYLVISDAHTDVQPETTYQVFLNLATGATPASDGVHYVGSINFFDRERPTRGRYQSFNVTNMLQKLRAAGVPLNTLEVSIVPSRTPSEQSHPEIAAIELIKQPSGS